MGDQGTVMVLQSDASAPTTSTQVSTNDATSSLPSMTLADAVGTYRSRYTAACDTTDALSYLTPSGCMLEPGDLNNHAGAFQQPMQFLKEQCHGNTAQPAACAALERVTSTPSQAATLHSNIVPSVENAGAVCEILFGADECKKPCTADTCQSWFRV